MKYDTVNDKEYFYYGLALAGGCFPFGVRAGSGMQIAGREVASVKNSIGLSSYASSYDTSAYNISALHTLVGLIADYLVDVEHKEWDKNDFINKMDKLLCNGAQPDNPSLAAQIDFICKLGFLCEFDTSLSKPLDAVASELIFGLSPIDADDIILEVIGWMLKKSNSIYKYSQDNRMAENYGDCSSTIWKAFYNTFNVDITGCGLKSAATSDYFAKTIVDKGMASIILDGSYGARTGKYNATYGYGGCFTNPANYALLRVGDIVTYDYTSTGDSSRFHGIDHVAMIYEAGGTNATTKLIECTPSITTGLGLRGGVGVRHIFAPDTVVRVVRLTQKAIDACRHTGRA